MNKTTLLSSIKTHFILWNILWLLLTINIYVIIGLSTYFSLTLFFAMLVIAGIGLLLLRILSQLDIDPPAEEEEEHMPDLPENWEQILSEVMEKIRPMCEQIFHEQIEQLLTPVQDSLYNNAQKEVNWLWEKIDTLMVSIKKANQSGYTTMKQIPPLNNVRNQLINKCNSLFNRIEVVINSIEDRKYNDQKVLEQWIGARSNQLYASLEKEKDMFYDFITKILIENIRNEQEPEDIIDFFDFSRLGEQYALLVSKTLEGRLASFYDSVIDDMENLSSDVVGRIQKATQQLSSIYKEILDIIADLIKDLRGNSAAITSLNSYALEISELENKTTDIMLTLAWQEILLEKCWQEIIKGNLEVIKNKVTKTIGSDVIEYITEILEKEVFQVGLLRVNPEAILLYKPLLDAEIIYQLYTSNKMTEVISDGVYSLLHYVIPLELIAAKTIRLSDNGIAIRRQVKDQIKTDIYQNQFQKVIDSLSEKNIGQSIANLYPQGFHEFCNSPYIKQKPENLNQAAWIVFLLLVTEENAPDDKLYQLVGLLLAASQIRNQHIHPIKNEAIPVESPEKLTLMRYICHQATEILISGNIKVSVARIELRYNQPA